MVQKSSYWRFAGTTRRKTLKRNDSVVNETYAIILAQQATQTIYTLLSSFSVSVTILCYLHLCFIFYVLGTSFFSVFDHSVKTTLDEVFSWLRILVGFLTNTLRIHQLARHDAPTWWHIQPLCLEIHVSVGFIVKFLSIHILFSFLIPVLVSCTV